MTDFNLQSIVRPNIWALQPYSCARDEFKGRPASVFLDANENPYNGTFSRYPDPMQDEVKAKLSMVKGVAPNQMFLGNGSDEAIDLVFRIFCTPHVDNVVAIEPTYGMYRVCADINDVTYRAVALEEGYQLNARKLLEATDKHTKAIFLCSPNNPSGNALERQEVEKVLANFRGVVIVDEAYSEFYDGEPFRLSLDEYPNLIVLNTMSKAWGCAAIRLGMAFASPEIIDLFNKVKYPYNVNILTQQKALEMLRDIAKVQKWVVDIKKERASMLPAFADLPVCEKVYPTDANFFLAKVTDANAIYNYLIDNGIVVRNRNRVALCGNCLRITIGTPQENCALLAAMRKLK